MKHATDQWLQNARISHSPNLDDRPDESDINLLVIHNISLPPNKYGGSWIEDFFLNKLDDTAHPYFAEITHLCVSAHLLIQRNGAIIQFVPFNKRAWHAGVSCFDGQQKCNDFSIGIELEGSDNENFTNAQYSSLLQATQEIQQLYPAITRQRITGHSDIAPGRKTDPGPYFDWPAYLKAIDDQA